MDEQPPAEPRSLTLVPRDLYGLVGVVFLLFLLLGGPIFVESPVSFWAPASQAESSCPLNLDPENARQTARAPLKAWRTHVGTDRSHAAFMGESVALVTGVRPHSTLPNGDFVPAAAPQPRLPGHHGLASFALPPPLA